MQHGMQYSPMCGLSIICSRLCAHRVNGRYVISWGAEWEGEGCLRRSKRGATSASSVMLLVTLHWQLYVCYNIYASGCNTGVFLWIRCSPHT